MKKAWVYKRKNIKGWWCGWYENGKRKSKSLPNKALAEHFCYIKYTQLNSDVFASSVAFDWTEMVNKYHHTKQVEGLVDDSIYEALLTLRHFKRLVDPNSSSDVTQQALDTLIDLASKQAAAMMCSEGDHHHCHRHLLITPALLSRAVTVLHIQPAGSLVNAADEPRQLSLFY